jgi:septum site-determining protein MinC
MSQTIIAKGIADKIAIQMSEEDWGEAKNSLVNYIEQNRIFLQGARIILQTGLLSLRSNDLFELRNQLEDYSITIYAIDSQVEDTRRSARLLGIKLHTTEPTKPSASPVGQIQTNELNPLYLERTIRSGQTIDHPGHVILVGEVNPGGSIRAEGNIMVWGKVKGEVHAGTRGNTAAVIMAFELTPSVLTIAGVSCPTPIKKHGKPPEYAHVDGNAIKIDTWKI